jgi:hypothetical protein
MYIIYILKMFRNFHSNATSVILEMSNGYIAFTMGRDVVLDSEGNPDFKGFNVVETPLSSDFRIVKIVGEFGNVKVVFSPDEYNKVFTMEGKKTLLRPDGKPTTNGSFLILNGNAKNPKDPELSSAPYYEPAEDSDLETYWEVDTEDDDDAGINSLNFGTLPEPRLMEFGTTDIGRFSTMFINLK